MWSSIHYTSITLCTVLFPVLLLVPLRLLRLVKATHAAILRSLGRHQSSPGSVHCEICSMKFTPSFFTTEGSPAAGCAHGQPSAKVLHLPRCRGRLHLVLRTDVGFAYCLFARFCLLLLLLRFTLCLFVYVVSSGESVPSSMQEFMYPGPANYTSWQGQPGCSACCHGHWSS